jgi:hypothetical protein
MMTTPLIATPGSLSPVADSSELAWRLLDENRDLIGSLNYATLRTTGSRVVLYSRPTDESLMDLAGWAERYGGSIVGSSSIDEQGMRWRSCRVGFEFLGERVEVCAYIPRPRDSVRDA